ncbi:MAG: hypothetical protein JNL01_15930 [Bdellovibrionales bacterium]|nr:hypothetical protein [Bdellovibrionales bacterium]
MKNYLKVLSSISVLASGCASAQFSTSKVGSLYAPRRTPEQIEIYQTQGPKKKYEEIGIVYACCGHTDAMVELMKKKAAECGGDAIYSLQDTGAHSMNASVLRFE